MNIQPASHRIINSHKNEVEYTHFQAQDSNQCPKTSTKKGSKSQKKEIHVSMGRTMKGLKWRKVVSSPSWPNFGMRMAKTRQDYNTIPVSINHRQNYSSQP